MLFYLSTNKGRKVKYKTCSSPERNLGKYLISPQLHKKPTIRKKKISSKRKHFDVHQSEQCFRVPIKTQPVNPIAREQPKITLLLAERKPPLLRKIILA